MKKYLEKIIEHEHLSFDESKEVMDMIMNGEINNSHLAGFLTALKSKKETADEIAGFATSMRNKAIKIETDISNTIDVCGTGGDGSGTFNISTAVAFVVAGTGTKVAKHGNRSISSKSGSADVLKELGININLSPEKSQMALDKIGITFLFAPQYHPAMKYAAPVRQELGIKTVFNILGPLTNPANVKKQLIGTFSKEAAESMVKAAPLLDYERVCFVCSENKLDEISLNESTDIYEFDSEKGFKHFKIDNTTFGFDKVPFDAIKGGSPETNAKIILDILENKKVNGAYHTVIANAAMALYAAKYSDNLKICIEAAETSIKSGKAFEKFIQLKNFSE